MLAQAVDQTSTRYGSQIRMRDFQRQVYPDFVDSKLYDIFNDAMDRVIAGECKRLLVSVPASVGKTEKFSRQGAACYLRNRPGDRIFLSASTGQLSLDISEEARRYYVAAGGVLPRAAYAKSRWNTGFGGGMIAVGVGGQVTGRHGDLLIMEDPTKNAEEAMSPGHYPSLQRWWDSVWRKRLKPGGAMIVVSTRWPYGDLIHWLLQRELDESTREGWHFICFDFVREPNPYPDVPESVTLEPDWREVGETLVPERYDPEDVRRRVDWRRSTDDDQVRNVWSRALDQQRPEEEGVEGRVAWNFGSKNIHADIDWWRGAAGRIQQLVAFVDFNVNPMCCVLGQIVTDQVQYLDEIELREGGTQAMIDAILARYPRNEVLSYVCYPDPAGRATATAGAGKSDHYLFRAAGFEIRARSRAPRVRDRINAFNEKCGRNDQEIELWVHPRCERLREALLRHRFDGTGKPTKKADYEYDHWFDAVSYAVELEFPQRTGSAVTDRPL